MTNPRQLGNPEQCDGNTHRLKDVFTSQELIDCPTCGATVGEKCKSSGYCAAREIASRGLPRAESPMPSQPGDITMQRIIEHYGETLPSSMESPKPPEITCCDHHRRGGSAANCSESPKPGTVTPPIEYDAKMKWWNELSQKQRDEYWPTITFVNRAWSQGFRAAQSPESGTPPTEEAERVAAIQSFDHYEHICRDVGWEEGIYVDGWLARARQSPSAKELHDNLHWLTLEREKEQIRAEAAEAEVKRLREEMGREIKRVPVQPSATEKK